MPLAGFTVTDAISRAIISPIQNEDRTMLAPLVSNPWLAAYVEIHPPIDTSSPT